ncbi:flavin-dependent monooxygenase QhpG [Methylocaldum marinum]|uniref:flavin-dependent monooxygenase QhpG n=1 Tax=Methylocaldum marinum TaxID=1432792 RepID=UPI000E69DD6C|nr:NAD(P)/FAD-dependent oxidoreductase [Methylocaldum marinum]
MAAYPASAQTGSTQPRSTVPAYDVVVLGAGPAGTSAALRLAALGHRTALVERSDFPRPHVGESLSPGIGNILDYLGLPGLATAASGLSDLPGWLLWDDPEPRPILPEQRGPACMVDRARFDALLLDAARTRGVAVLQPARLLASERNGDTWRLTIRHGAAEMRLHTRLLLDATGRAGQRPRRRLPLSAETLSICARVEAGTLPHATHIEALPEGWLWGSPHPAGDYRIMAFVDPVNSLRPAARLSALLERSRLFNAAQGRVTAVLVRPATAHCDAEPWREGRIKLGDAAFALDPLSSSGVEKAMRFALQTVIAVNTLLREPTSTELAREFYEDRLTQAVITHGRWTAGYYARAFGMAEQPFWQARAKPWQLPSDGDASPWWERLRLALAEPASAESVDAPPLPPISALNDPVHAWNRPVALCPELRIVQVPCVIDDCVRRGAAVAHPALAHPVAFLAGVELVPLLDAVPVVGSLGQLVGQWADTVPRQAAVRMAGWLLQRGVLRLV